MNAQKRPFAYSKIVTLKLFTLSFPPEVTLFKCLLINSLYKKNLISDHIYTQPLRCRVKLTMRH